MIALYRKLYGLRCPACQHLQPVFGLSATFRGGLRVLPPNAYVYCATCAKRLKLVARYSLASTVGFQIASVLAGLLAFLVILLPVFGISLSRFGLWGLLAWPLLLIVWVILGSAIAGTIGALYREVKTLCSA